MGQLWAPPPLEPSAPPPPPERSCPSPTPCPTHEHRYQVYKDLWGRGLYLTHGGKFGGDFLVYPGPPSLFHASSLVTCLSPGSRLALGSLVTFARLGTHVRKTLVLSSPGPPGGGPVYTSVQWRADLG
ncbi:tRNA-splicing endonuclease subunit Sen34 [Melopsittacus undulatus]|uniref:tRNA-splicing endonuclease subunit Sen34 n=1 Tax=Melopsittacus undulatus TaxID=13146 RepID=UPI00146A3E92|nr:tRNA-splicing endonuclease subunit Sen34 [Melopsittacus undulatus]